jgi:hypothetical protein
MATSENTLKNGMEDLKISDAAHASMADGQGETTGHWQSLASLPQKERRWL